MSAHLRLLHSINVTDPVYYNTRAGAAPSGTPTATGLSYNNDPYAYNYTSQGNNNDPTTLVLFILFVTFSICLILMRLTCYYDVHPVIARQPNGQEDPRRSVHFRTQDSIENMLVLKKVMTIDDALDTEKAKEEPNSAKKFFKRRKSNLLLHSGANELDESRTCPICLCEYENGEQICWSHNQKCAHHFHAQCGIAWLAKHSECPICRAEYLVEPDEESQPESISTPAPCDPSSEPQPPAIAIIEEEEDLSDSQTNSETPRGDDAV